jgi:hypothetical protein
MLRALKRSLKDSLRAHIRQLWEQCDLFDAPPPPVRPPMVPPDRVRAAPPPIPAPVSAPVRRAPRTHPSDASVLAQLLDAHQRYNVELFEGRLRPVPIRISGRMKNRLGHYMAALPSAGIAAEIAISRRHIRLDDWSDVLHTLVHEMVHQWQDENGLPLDHGRHFRMKARAVGISARATRPAGSAASDA